MSLTRTLLTTTGLLALLAMAGDTAAGTFFRLEVGPAVAAGTGAKVKDFKKLVLVVRPRLCDSLASVQITGTAEGTVNGARQSVPLKLVEIDRAEGVYGVPHQWPDGGQWVLRLDGSCPAPRASASTIVPLAKSGFIREKTEVLREPATSAQVEAALKSLARSAS